MEPPRPVSDAVALHKYTSQIIPLPGCSKPSRSTMWAMRPAQYLLRIKSETPSPNRSKTDAVDIAFPAIGDLKRKKKKKKNASARTNVARSPESGPGSETRAPRREHMLPRRNLAACVEEITRSAPANRLAGRIGRRRKRMAVP